MKMYENFLSLSLACQRVNISGAGALPYFSEGISEHILAGLIPKQRGLMIQGSIIHSLCIPKLQVFISHNQKKLCKFY